jgi:hypothetical protein
MRLLFTFRHALEGVVIRRSDEPGEVRLSFRKPHFRSCYRTAFPDEKHERSDRIKVRSSAEGRYTTIQPGFGRFNTSEVFCVALF